MSHLFLTVMMILCSLLHRGQPLSKRTEVLAALRQARTIWMRRSTSSREAKRATEIASLTLARAGDGKGNGSHAVEEDAVDGGQQNMAIHGASTITSSDYTTGLGVTNRSQPVDFNGCLHTLAGFARQAH
ncbi:uncharacterized protein ACLA_055370 [Aspergillus clavatus NRRL 1]|uniref:Secreted protein n=1 Tax=Aspergillus clavatus (strain ATCC 1007 / CBS 513.65 / DSM 816 / NCTC 3887 / NRRL 1 / QM 1276 / 107) TaxID=344612 RepID=A1C9G5_ASPCL|nr:uncharacterized protein ACLA_055370 [Aspergillus clavatus NRRL 1]EAW13489.1 hypothetical protein ACLA_055370 [Aspergillus clavatus NRRL 1]